MDPASRIRKSKKLRNLDSRVRENDANRDIGVSWSHGWLKTTAHLRHSLIAPAI